MKIDKVEKLIEIVRGHTFLFDLSHKHYKNASLKYATWEAIGRELNEKGETVRSKWKTIRDGYTKYKKQLKCSIGCSKKTVNYTWASQLAFLDSFYGPRPCSSTSVVESDYAVITSEFNPSPPQSTLSKSEVPPLFRGRSSEAAASSTASTTRVQYRKKRGSTRKNVNDKRGSQLYAKKIRQYDVIDNLFLSYADTFKKFPLREQAIAKLELAKLFSSIELQLLDHNSSGSAQQYTSTTSPACSNMSSIEDHTFYSADTLQIKDEESSSIMSPACQTMSSIEDHTFYSHEPQQIKEKESSPITSRTCQTISSIEDHTFYSPETLQIKEEES